MKPSCIDGEDGKVPSSEMVDTSASCSEEEGANVSCIYVCFLTVASE